MSIFRRKKPQPFIASHVWVDGPTVKVSNDGGENLWTLKSTGVGLDSILFEVARNTLRRIEELEAMK